MGRNEGYFLVFSHILQITQSSTFSLLDFVAFTNTSQDFDRRNQISSRIPMPNLSRRQKICLPLGNDIGQEDVPQFPSRR